MRLQKYIAECGVASRRAAERLIADGRISVNGNVIDFMGFTVDPQRDTVELDGNIIKAETKKYYIMLNKPKNYVTTVSDEFDRPTVMELVRDINARIYPVGRLDFDTSGLLIMTNDGDFANRLTHPSSHVNKTYRVTVKGDVTDEKLIEMREGILLDGKKTLPCDCFVAERKEDRTVLIFILNEGRNRQIRRMCEAVDLSVVRLKRTEIAGVKLGMLPQGKWRELNEREMRRLTNVSQSKEEES